MGKKATFLLLRCLGSLATVLLFIAALVCAYASQVDPRVNSDWVMVSLCLPIVLIANGVSFVWWLVHKRWLAIVPLAAIVVNLGFVSSVFQLPNPWRDTSREHDFRVLSYNIHGFRQEIGFRESVARIGHLLHREQADVVCLQEIRLGRDLTADSIASILKYPYYRSEHALAIFSRYPITNSTYLRFNDLVNGAMIADIRIGNRTLRLFNVHMQTTGVAPLLQRSRRERTMVPVSKIFNALTVNSMLRAAQADRLARLIDMSDMPVIVAGDLNDMPSSFTYRRLKGELKDGFRQHGSGYGSTFRPIKGLLRLDYIFCGKGVENTDYFAPDITLSDHRPVVADMRFQ